VRKTLIGFLFLQAWLPLRGQVPPLLPAKASSLQTPVEKQGDALAHARQIYTEQGARLALPEFERALTLYQASGDRHGEAVTLGLIGNCYKRLGDSSKALELLGKALAMKQELGDRLEEGKTLNNIGLVYWDLAEYQTATEYFTRAISIGKELSEPRLEGAAQNNLARVHHDQGDYQRSMAEDRRALALYRDTHFDQGISDTVGNLGGTLLDLGRYAEALQDYEEALVISRQLKSKISMSQDLGNMALCYMGLGQVDEALRRFNEAESLAHEAGLKKEEADWQKGKGSALVRGGKYDAALEQYRRALGSYEQAGLKRELVEALGDLGALHLLLGDVASAENDFHRAIEVSRAINYPRGVIENLIALGNIESRRQRFEQGVALYREALAKATEADDRASLATAAIQLALAHRDLGQLESAALEAVQAAEVAQKTGAPDLEAGAEYAQGEVARKRGAFEEAIRHFVAGERILQSAPDPELAWRIEFGEGEAQEDLKKNQEALSAYRKAVQTIEDVRSQLREERFRSGYVEDKYQVYIATVELLLRLNRPNEAFLFSEKLRAQSLLNLLNHGAPPLRDPAQSQAESALRQRIARLQSLTEQENSKPESQRKRQAVDVYSSELLEAERAYQNFLDDLMRTDPSYAEAWMERVPSGPDVQKTLPSDTALVEYLVGENQVSLFVLRADGLFAQAIPLRAEDLRIKAELLRDLIAREHGEEWRQPAESLYRLLIQPIREAGWLAGVKRLYVVPHGILHYVPFGALPSGKAKTAPLLIDQYEVAYLPAAAALVYDPAQAKVQESALVLAPAQPDLKYAQEEARRVAGLFPGDSRLVLGAQATETQFKSLAGSYDVLHLAAHGYFNKSNPLLSGILLEPDAANDGRLEVHEILALRLNARLVTLSACETALGSGYFADVPAGDDLVGLTRAFLFAGSSAVLASLWEVNDRSTSMLMRGFYGRLNNSNEVAALATVQRQMGHSPGRLSHPYFWAAFVLVGRMK
jgi:CHAT domain-containing protein/tetratricopeptide (TPR) repeat protein